MSFFKESEEHMFEAGDLIPSSEFSLTQGDEDNLTYDSPLLDNMNMTQSFSDLDPTTSHHISKPPTTSVPSHDLSANIYGAMTTSPEMDMLNGDSPFDNVANTLSHHGQATSAHQAEKNQHKQEQQLSISMPDTLPPPIIMATLPSDKKKGKHFANRDPRIRTRKAAAFKMPGRTDLIKSMECGNGKQRLVDENLSSLEQIQQHPDVTAQPIYFTQVPTAETTIPPTTPSVSKDSVRKKRTRTPRVKTPSKKNSMRNSSKKSKPFMSGKAFEKTIDALFQKDGNVVLPSDGVEFDSIGITPTTPGINGPGGCNAQKQASGGPVVQRASKSAKEKNVATPRGGKKAGKEKKGSNRVADEVDIATLDEMEEDSDDEGGRKKIKIDYIGAKRNRQVTFLKRKNGVMKKAMELGVLTGCDVAIIMHNADNGKTFEYSSQKMEQVLCNYGTYSGPLERRTTERFYDLAGSKMNINIPSDNVKLSKVALRAANTAAYRPRPYHKFEPSSRVEVVRVNGKRLSSGETAPVAVLGKRDAFSNPITSRGGTSERPMQFARIGEYQSVPQLLIQPSSQHQPHLQLHLQHQLQHQLQNQLQHQLQNQLQLKQIQQQAQLQFHHKAASQTPDPLLQPLPQPLLPHQHLMENACGEGQLHPGPSRALSSLSDPAAPAPWIVDDAEPPSSIMSFVARASSNDLPDVTPTSSQVQEKEVEKHRGNKMEPLVVPAPTHVASSVTAPLPVCATVDSENLLPLPPPLSLNTGENGMCNVNDENGEQYVGSPMSIGPSKGTGQNKDAMINPWEAQPHNNKNDKKVSAELNIDSGLGTNAGTGMELAAWHALTELTSPVSGDSPKVYSELDVDKLLEVGITGDGGAGAGVGSEAGAWTSSWIDRELMADREATMAPIEGVEMQDGCKLDHIHVAVEAIESNVGTDAVDDLFGLSGVMGNDFLLATD